MAKNMKTPAMVLQEYTVRQNVSPPEYNLIHSRMGTHENEFHYQVTVGDVVAMGFGRSKQVAKHDAAQKALISLAKKGKFHLDDDSIQEFNARLHRNETDSRSVPPTNFVGTLKDLCGDHKILPPIFVEVSDVGPPHARQFTWKCTVSSITTQATANTKKQAKQLCAMDMLERLKDILPEIVELEELKKKAILEDEQIIQKYRECNPFPNVVPNKSIYITDYDTVMKSLMEEYNLTFDDFREEFSERTEEALGRMLSKLELQYKFEILQNKPYIVVLCISLDVPFACIGSAIDLEEAKSKAVLETFMVLEYYLDADTLPEDTLASDVV